MDSLQANMTLLAAEQTDWEEKRSSQDPLALGTAELNVACYQHQACLAKRPAILAVEGLASGLVRMAHCMRSSTFATFFEKFFQELEQNLERRQVPVLPVSVQLAKDSLLIEPICFFLCTNPLILCFWQKVNHIKNQSLQVFVGLHFFVLYSCHKI